MVIDLPLRPSLHSGLRVARTKASWLALIKGGPKTGSTSREAEWLKKTWTSSIRLVIKFANKLADHRVGVLNYFDHHITTGMVEGINNIIKVLKRKAYGYRDMEYFLLRIYFIHEARYTLTG